MWNVNKGKRRISTALNVFVQRRLLLQGNTWPAKEWKVVHLSYVLLILLVVFLGMGLIYLGSGLRPIRLNEAVAGVAILVSFALYLGLRVWVLAFEKPVGKEALLDSYIGKRPYFLLPLLALLNLVMLYSPESFLVARLPEVPLWAKALVYGGAFVIALPLVTAILKLPTVLKNARWAREQAGMAGRVKRILKAIVSPFVSFFVAIKEIIMELRKQKRSKGGS